MTKSFPTVMHKASLLTNDSTNTKYYITVVQYV